MSAAGSLAGRKRERFAHSEAKGGGHPKNTHEALERLATAHAACSAFARNTTDPSNPAALNDLALSIRQVFAAKVVAIRAGISVGGALGIAPQEGDVVEWVEALEAGHMLQDSASAIVTLSAHGGGAPAIDGVTQIVLVPLRAQDGPGLLCLGFGDVGSVSPDELTCLRVLGDHLSLALSCASARAASQCSSEQSARQARSTTTDELVSLAAHELRTPLTPITMLLQSLERKARNGTVDVEAVVRSRRQVNRLTLMISELLDLSRLQQDRLSLAQEPFDLRQILNRAVDEHLQNDPRHRVEISSLTEPLVILGDSLRIAQSLLSLLQHVTRMTPADSVIRVDLGRDDHQQAAVITIRGERPHPPPEAPHAAEVAPPSAPRAQPLALAVHLAEALTLRQGGTLSISTARGQEARVVATFPLTASELETNPH